MTSLKTAPKLDLPVLYRCEPIEIRVVEGGDKEKGGRKRFVIAVSSEFPVRRFFGFEVLSHEKGAIDLARAKRGISVRDTHFGDQVGIAKDPEVGEDKKLRFTIDFSENERPQEIQRDVEARIRIFVSLGYRALKAKLIESSDNNVDKFLITRWEPIHVAFVADPADWSIGVGRAEPDEKTFPVEIEGGDPAEEERTMPPKTTSTPTATGDPAGATEPTATGAAVATRSVEGDGNRPPIEVGVAESRKHAAEVIRMCETNKCSERAAEFIERGLTPNQAAFEILNARTTTGSVQPPAEAVIDLPERDIARYSYSRAILLAAGDVEGGLEADLSREIEKQLPAGTHKRGGIFIPMRLRNRLEDLEEERTREIQHRVLDSKTAGAGAETVFDQPGELIELLRNRAVLAQLGARFLTGLTAPVPFPKQTGAAQAHWVGENPGVDVPGSQVATGIVTLDPKTLQADTAYSRQLLAVQSIDGEAMVRDDLATVHALAVDQSGIHGLGSAGEPYGVYLVPDAQPLAMGGIPSYDKVVEMTGKAATKNALRGTLGWVTTPGMAAKLKTVPVISGAAAGFVWEGNILDGDMAGFRAMSTNQISALMSGSDETGGSEHGMVFANWADLLVGFWGAMELIVDPFAKKKQGLIEVTSFQMTDILLRHGESFVKSTGATTV